MRSPETANKIGSHTNTFAKKLGVATTLTSAVVQTLTADPAPAAGVDTTAQTIFNKGGIIAMDVPAQPGRNNARFFLPVIFNQAGEAGIAKGGAINFYFEGENPTNRNYPSISVDAATLTNINLNVHFFSSTNAYFNSPTQGTYVVSIPLTNTTLTPLSTVTNSQGALRIGYNAAYNLPTNSLLPEVTNGTPYAIGYNFSQVDANGQKEVTTLVGRILPSAATNGVTFFTNGTNAPQTLAATTSGAVTNMAGAFVFTGQPAPVDTILSMQRDAGTNAVFKLESFSGNIADWRLYSSADVAGPYATLVTNTPPDSNNSWTIPFSTLESLAGTNGFFRAKRE